MRAPRPSWAWLALTGPSLMGCSPEPETLPPLAEAVVVVDTDAPVPRLVSNLRIDLYQLDGTWLRSLDVPRSSPDGWPLSFSVFSPEEGRGGELLLRLRAFPDNKVRDYRGERFIPVPAPDAYPDRCPGADPAYREDKRLLARDEAGELLLGEDGAPIDITPLEEPLPNLTIDRLVRVRLEAGVSGALRVLLHGACFGTEANLFDLETCVDTAGTYVPVEPVVGTAESSLGPSEVGSWPPPAPCAGETEVDEVCVDGGAFILGDLGVFGFGRFDAFPERVAVIPPLRVQRFEVTVGELRAWLQGFPELTPPVDDGNGPCTWGEGDDLPVNCVTWETARAYCRDRGGDLPTEAQWEWLAAAAGRDRQDRFPFGSQLASCDQGVHARAPAPALGATECSAFGLGPQPATEPRGDVTPVYGLAAMGGNVREWVRDEYRAYCSSGWRATTWADPWCRGTGSAARTARGGDWTVSAELMLSAIREQRLDRTDSSHRVGFRCVRPPPDG